jgi:putative transcriptional regulator
MDLGVDYFKIEHNNVAPMQGKVLISEPFLDDIYFKRSVILLASNENGYFVGFVLNKFTEIDVHSTIKDFPKFDAKVSVGGPVRVDTIHFIHTLGEAIPDSVKIMDNLWWGGSFDVLKRLITENLIDEGQVRFFLGYSGWEPKQLEREISENSWLVSDLNADEIMNSDSAIWKETLTKLGNRYKIWTTFPENPTLN